MLHSEDTSVMKIDSSRSPKGKLGQKYLATGIHLGMRLFENLQPHDEEKPHSRPYETVGFVIKGKALLHLEEQVVTLEPGDSWVVPKDAVHSYEILEPFTAVEATSPPSQIHGRDD